MRNQLTALNLETCDAEPIHIPGRVQPHGVLLVLSPAGHTIRHVSRNTAGLLGVEPESVIGQPVEAVLDAHGAREVRNWLREESIEANPTYAVTVASARGGNPLHAIIHRFKGNLFVELEPPTPVDEPSFSNLYGLVRAATGALKGASSVADLCRIAAREVRRITGFDRVMVYQFDEDWNGAVLAEDKIEGWDSYLGLHFPASDIPKQARQLYLLNRLRLIVDVEAPPADLLPAEMSAGEPVDMTYAVLRSVSPVHIEYLRNMGVGASMSISVVKDGRLWGLIACHHRTARRLAYEIRAACEHLGEIFALQLSAKEYAEGADRRIARSATQNRLLSQMASHDDLVDGLLRGGDDLLALADAGGCAVFMNGALHLVGRTPPPEDVRKLVEWLSAGHDGTYHTDHLSAVYPEAAQFTDTASGILALAIPRFRKNLLVWFRPEIIQSVAWAGDPGRPAEQGEGGGPALHPRKSFEAWKQIVRGRSLPWDNQTLQAATGLREVIVDIILRKAEELARLNSELLQSNRELEAFSYSVSHDLRAPFRHIFGFCDLLQKHSAAALDDTGRRYIRTIMEAAHYAGTLVDNLLAFSQMGRTALRPRQLDMAALVQEVRDDLHEETAGRGIDWRVAALPPITGDLMMVKLAVRNLLSNAIKFTRTREHAVIEVGARDEGDQSVFWVRDNGVGFDMRYVDKLFGVFQRLHRAEEFEGTGIGLANVRRTIERHGGKVWAESSPDGGATFYFSLPKRL